MTRVANQDARGLPLGNAGAVVTVGTFDGMHLGHLDLLKHMVTRATATQRPSVLVTFDPHPLRVIKPDVAPPLLTTFHEKLEWIAQCGVTYVVVLPFTRTLASYEAEQFVTQVLRTRYAMTELLVGHDHGLGRGRLGDTDVLRALGREHGFAVTVLDPVVGRDGAAVSSTTIRRAIVDGDLKAAALGLGRPYSVSGRVVGGDRRGRLLGYPTANLETPAPEKLLPPDGVYAVRAHTPQGTFGGMMNLGPRPTFGDQERRLETHVFDASHDWYHQPVKLDLLARLRGTKAFADSQALIAQLSRDENDARLVLAAESGPTPA